MKIIATCLICLGLSTTINAQDWSLLEEIAPSEASMSDFGTNMIFAEGKLVVSWPRLFTNGENADSCGEIITYQKDSAGNYQEIARLTAEDLIGSCKLGDAFGESLSFNQGRLAIGMPAGQRKGWGFSGTAVDTESRIFITHFSNGNWQLDEVLTVDDLVDGQSGMGVKVVLDDDILLVQANTYDSIFGVSFAVSNGVYIFENSENGFEMTQKLTENVHLYAQAFDYENNQIIVGSFGEQNISTAGRVDVYEKTDSTWINIQTIADMRNINLGIDVNILNDTMAIGGVHAGGIGGVGIYSKDGNGIWSEIQYIEASDGHDNDQFGFEAELFADELIIGAPVGDSPNTPYGAVYYFIKNTSGQFIEKQKLTAAITGSDGNNFGAHIIYNESDLLVNGISGGLGGSNTQFNHYSRESNGGTTTYNVNPKISGTYTSDAGNQGVSLEILTDGRAVMFASLNNESNNLWLFATGTVTDNTIEFSHVYKTNGAQFGAAFDPSDVDVTEIGTALISFSQCKVASLSYEFSTLASGEITLNKDLEIPGNECNNTNKALPNGVSGAWYEPSRSGEGFSNYLYEENGVQMAKVTWFTYDANGKQMWLSGTGTVSNKTVNIAEMKQYTGANLFNGTTQNSNKGSLSMTWDECHRASINYDFSIANLGSGTLDLSQLTVLNNTQCNLK